MALTSKPQNTVGQKIYNKNTATGISQLMVARARYDFSVDGGAIGLITPKFNVTIPDNAVIVGGTINSTTAFVGATATISIGTSAGSSATSILGVTAVASYSLDARINAVPVFATPVKMTASGVVTLTVATAPLTAGVAEIVLYYWVAGN
mgnify:CR=1 FL=1